MTCYRLQFYSVFSSHGHFKTTFTTLLCLFLGGHSHGLGTNMADIVHNPIKD